jgi:tRNA(fMet)-specific endonuclease VapC
VIRFLLDTNIISEPVRLQPNPGVINKLKEHEFEIAMASVTWHELLFGYYRLPVSKKRSKIEKYLKDTIQPKISILYYDDLAAEWFAEERSRLVALGKTPGYPDGQIAAISKINNLILVTNNISDFIDFQEIQLENWFI